MTYKQQYIGLCGHRHSNIRHGWNRSNNFTYVVGICPRRWAAFFQIRCQSKLLSNQDRSHLSLTHTFQVDQRTHLPLYAIGITTIINLLLALINIGSSVGFDAFISLAVASYYSSFILSASVMLNKRLTTPNSDLPWGPFRLGRAGVPVTVVAIAYSVLGAFFSMWPTAVKPSAESMNYCVVVFGGVMVFSLLFWIVYGRKHYTGPVLELRN